MRQATISSVILYGLQNVATLVLLAYMHCAPYGVGIEIMNYNTVGQNSQIKQFYVEGWAISWDLQDSELYSSSWFQG